MASHPPACVKRGTAIYLDRLAGRPGAMLDGDWGVMAAHPRPPIDDEGNMRESSAAHTRPPVHRVVGGARAIR